LLTINLPVSELLRGRGVKSLILITGSRGLIGRSLVERLAAKGIACREFDIARSAGEDTRDQAALSIALEGVTGVVHLAAISRVVWAERDPGLTQSVNVDALQFLLGAMALGGQRPWLLFASSREVYGEPASLPVAEDAPLAPLNVYARSKVNGELLVERAREAGILANIVRFSNVYGCIDDHSDRVVPAFARTAAHGGALRLDGPDNMFDFTHVDDVVRGLEAHIEATAAREFLPPVHFLTGVGTTLNALADMAARASTHELDVEIAPPRNYDVARFVGDASRAHSLLGWQARIDLATGFAALTEAYRSAAGLPPAAASRGLSQAAVGV